MRTKLVLFVLLLSTCLTLSGQQSKTATAQKQPQKTTTQILNEQQEAISQLQADNLKLQADNEKLQETNEKLQDQLDRVEKDINVYREDVRAKTAEIDANLEHWFAILSIIVTILCVVPPFMITTNKEKIIEKMMEDVKMRTNTAIEQALSAETQAMDAKKSISKIEMLEKQVNQILTQINKDKDETLKAAQRAEASQLFSEAYNQKDDAKAIDLYNRAISLRPDFHEAFNNRGLRKDKLKDWKGAKEDIEKALELSPNDADYYDNLGTMKDRLKEWVSAIEDYKKAIRLNPKNANYYNNLADTYRKIGKLAEAYTNVSTALDIDDKNAFAYVTRGQILLAMNKPTEAIINLDKGLSMDNTIQDGFESRAKCLRELAEIEQDPDKKTELLEKAKSDEEKAKSME